MPLSDLDRQLLIAREVGDVDEATGDPVLPASQGSTGIVMRNISRIWLSYASKETFSPYLRDLYTRRDCLDMVIAVLESQVDTTSLSGNVSLKLSQRIAARQHQRFAIQTEIDRIERIPYAPTSGAITVTAPVSAPYSNGPDANDARYLGSPYYPFTRLVR